MSPRHQPPPAKPKRAARSTVYAPTTELTGYDEELLIPAETVPAADYDYVYFWTNRSVSPLNGNDQQTLEEEELHRALRLHQIDPESIFEAGCGNGRLARFFAELYPNAPYQAIDLNARAVNLTRAVRPEDEAPVIYQADIVTLDPDLFYEDPDFMGYDLVIASGVLMHLPEEEAARAFDNLADLTNPDTGHLITIDWVPQEGELPRLRRRRKHAIAPWNFAHNYQRLFKIRASMVGVHRIDRRVIHVMKP